MYREEVDYGNSQSVHEVEGKSHMTEMSIQYMYSEILLPNWCIHSLDSMNKWFSCLASQFAIA